jgi:DNA-binding transcriptional LysR family regulator
MPDSLIGVLEFAAVVQEKGFSAAARRLGLSKSVVSARVRQLENRLEARLLHRSTRALRLTEAGVAFYRSCQDILGAVRQAEGAVASLAGAVQGRLRVSCTADFAADHIAPLLAPFREKYPEVDVDLAISDSYVNLLGEGVDVAIRYGPLADPNVVFRRLGPQRGFPVASPDYVRRRGLPMAPEELTAHDCLIFTPFAWGGEWRFVNRAGERRRVKVRETMWTNSGVVLRTAARHGAGISLLATVLAGRELRDGRLVRVLPDWEPDLSDRPGASIFAAYPDNVRVPPKVRAFVDFLSARIGDPPYWDDGV